MSFRTGLSLFLFVLGLGILLMLGCWQVKRLAWKNDIISTLDAEYKKDARAYKLQAEDFELPEQGGHIGHRGYVQGRFLSGKTLYWPNLKDGQYGFFILDPFTWESGNVLLINRGWVGRNLQNDQVLDKIVLPNVPEVLTVTGLLRPLEANTFTPNNRPSENKWYRFQPEQIKKTLSISGTLLPMVLYAETIEGAQNYKAALGDIDGIYRYPRNQHFQYALFWFAMAGVWCAVFGFYALSRRAWQRWG